MTNIGILGRRDKCGEMKFITAIADSQGTDMANETKSDRYVKIFGVGDDRNIILLGTGATEVILRTADKLRSQGGIKTVEEASGAVLDLTHQQYSEMTKGKPGILPRKGFGVDFLLGGPGSKELLMTSVNTTGFFGNPKSDKYGNRAAVPISVEKNEWSGAFRGSAWRHINRYIAGQSESGRPLIVEGIEDGLVEMHDLSLRGARDIGVNDKLHYAVITPSKTVSLVHPGSQFSDNGSFIEQVVNLTGLDVADVLKGRGDLTDPKRYSAAVDLAYDVGTFCAAFYSALSSQLGISSGLKREYTDLSERFFRDPAFRERFDEIGKLRKAALGRVGEGVTAMLSGDAGQMRDYVDAASKRESEMFDKLLSERGGKS